MTEPIFLQLSAYAGIVATLVLTINYLFGMMIGTSYQRSLYWKKMPNFLVKVSIYQWHDRTAYIALSFVLLHPVLLLFDPTTKFSFMDLVFPINAPTQRLYVALGTISMFAIILVIITSQKAVKKRLTFRAWKNIHLVSYVTGLLFIIHGIAMDPQLKDRPVDFLDAEKIASEACLLLLIGATVYRVRYEMKKRRANEFYKLHIGKIVNETADAKTFVLDIPDNLKRAFKYVPGQFILLKIIIDGQEYRRAYSLSSNPYVDHSLHFTVKRIKQGIVSNYINDTFKVADEILVFPPSGNFYREDIKTYRHLNFFAGGSGITPIYSIIKGLLYQSPSIHIRLTYANRDTSTIIFYNELEQLQETYSDRLSVTHVLSDASEGWNGIKGRVDKDNIKLFLKASEKFPVLDTEYYVCGPSPFMELVEYELLSHGIPPDQIHIEKFISIGNSESPVKVGHAPEDLNMEPAKINVQLNGANSIIECKQGQTLLDALIESGIDAPYSCKEGICSTCKAKLLDGKVIIEKHASLTDIDINEKQILTCQAVPLSKEVKIDFDAAI